MVFPNAPKFAIYKIKIKLAVYILVFANYNSFIVLPKNKYIILSFFKKIFLYGKVVIRVD